MAHLKYIYKNLKLIMSIIINQKNNISDIKFASHFLILLLSFTWLVTSFNLLVYISLSPYIDPIIPKSLCNYSFLSLRTLTWSSNVNIFWSLSLFWSLLMDAYQAINRIYVLGLLECITNTFCHFTYSLMFYWER